VHGPQPPFLFFRGENVVFLKKLTGSFGSSHLVEQVNDLSFCRIIIKVVELLPQEEEKSVGVDLPFSVSRIQAEDGVRKGRFSKMPKIDGKGLSFLDGNGW
jgi:hypothetical protein